MVKGRLAAELSRVYVARTYIEGGDRYLKVDSLTCPMKPRGQDARVATVQTPLETTAREWYSTDGKTT